MRELSQEQPQYQEPAAGASNGTAALPHESEAAAPHVIGPYEIREQIGEGGMASVYRAWHTGLHRHEALKIPRRGIEGVDTQYIQRLLSEARLAARLHHPHIVGIHNISEDGAAQPYFSMDLVQGNDLAHYLRERGSLPFDEALPILEQAAEALTHAHNCGVVHRDIKPENILLEQSDDGPRVKVVDFGISRAGEDSGGTRLTRSGFLVGTPEYMSPEQSGSGDEIDFHTDIYSLAIVAYEMLCGTPPFKVRDGGSPMTVLISHVRDEPKAPHLANPSISRAVSNVLLKALSKKPEDRYHSAEEFVVALRETAPSGVLSEANSLQSTKPNRGSWPGLIIAVCLGISIGWLGSVYASREEPPVTAGNLGTTAAITPVGRPVVSRVRRTVRRSIAFPRQGRKSAYLASGRRKIVRPGAAGLREVVLEISRRGSKEVERKVISSRIIRKPLTQVELYGTTRARRSANRRARPGKSVSSFTQRRKPPVRRSAPRRGNAHRTDDAARVREALRIFRHRMRRDDSSGPRRRHERRPNRREDFDVFPRSVPRPYDLGSHHS